MGSFPALFVKQHCDVPHADVKGQRDQANHWQGPKMGRVIVDCCMYLKA